jgi:glycosyltransferase involved in cell wall biosynthesis
MSLLFLNNTQETFTATQSGALATIIWECCRVAHRHGQQPIVISRPDSAPGFDWPAKRWVDYPAIPPGRLGTLLCRADRKVFGWRYFRQREYAHRVAKTIRAQSLQHLPMVLMNDPEMAVVLRDAFPKARIVHWFQNQQECKAKYRKLFAGAVDGVAGCSGFISRWIEGYYHLKPQSVKTLYNGVDANSFSPPAQAPDGLPVINFVGRTGIEKAPDLLLKAALRLAQNTTRFAVQMIGSNHWDRFELDDYQRQLSDLARQLEGAGVAVRRPGHIGRRDLPAEFRKAHIHVVPSRWDEPSALTIYEGMACGLATIASRTGGTPEIIGDCGILFQRDSVEELADALQSLLKDEDRRREYAVRARSRASEFTWQRVWNGILELTGN